MTSELLQSLTSQLAEVDALSLPIRRQVVAAFGHIEKVEKRAVVSPKLRALVELDSLVVKKILPCWGKNWPDDGRPERMLDYAQQYLDDQINPNALRVEMGRLYTLADNLLEDALWPSQVATAAAHVARTALYADPIADYADDEKKLDAEDWDTAFLGACIESGSVPWKANETQRKKQTEFWAWYLETAVPAAIQRLSEENK